MRRFIFLVEEPSIGEVLDVLLPRLLPPDVAHQVVPHEGKSDLEKSIPRKLRGWREPDIRFVVVRDNDGADCKVLKTRLTRLCTENGREEVLIRLVCQELEAWYLGDLEAVARAYDKPSLTDLQNKKTYRNPDRLSRPSSILLKLVPSFQKVAGARAIAPYMTVENNRSRSFQVFVSGIRRLATEE